MYWSKSLLLLVALFFVQTSCSGFFQIRLKSQYDQETKILIAPQGNSSFIVVPIRLHSEITRNLGPFPIDFNEKYTLTINGGAVEKLGINGSTHTAEFEPERGTLSPKQLHLPLNGLELIFECDENWRGAKCDTPCSYSCASSKANPTMEISTDYSIDMTKLSEIVKRLKETTKVDNEMRKEEKEEEKELKKENPRDVLGSSRPSGFPKSLFSDLFSNILSLHSQKSIDDTPRDVEVAPWTIMRKLSARKRNENEESKIEEHSSNQKSFGLRHRTPSRFSGLDGPAKSMLPLFSPLMGLMPRISTFTGDSSNDADFALDQIFRN